MPEPETLTRREREVASAYGDGLSYRQIAEKLGVAPATVRTHLQTIYRKLGVGNKIELQRALMPVSQQLTIQDDTKSKPGSIGETLLAPQPVVLVMPFADLSGGTSNHFFSDGLTEDILTRLNLLHGVNVIAKLPASVLSNVTPDAQQISRDLGATHALEGAVRVSESNVRVTARLTDTASSRLLWADKFDRPIADVFEVQDEITHAIVLSLQVELVDGKLALDPGGTNDYRAWEFFNRGVQEHLKCTSEGILLGRRAYNQAVQIDPKFSDAWAMLGWTYWQHARSGFSENPEEDYAECARILDQLNEDAADTPTIRHLKAASLLMAREYDAAIAVATSAVKMGPSKLFGHTPSSLVLAYSGRFQDAVDVLLETIRALPYTPNDTVYMLGWLLSLLGSHAEAIAYGEEYMERVPEDPLAYLALAIEYARGEKIGAARETIRKFRERYPRYTIADFVEREPHRETDVLNLMTAALREAGLPE